ncbi:MAG: glycosyltransferase family 4 protein [Ignavibacteria bacterium]|nr:glycosyltransferase family 4 protein [Ignavibacteria bacterium]
MIQRKRKVLYIAYYFPPMGLSGVQRTLKFVKYLPAHNWIPTVLTVMPAAYYATDHSLLKEIEASEVRVVRSNSLDANRVLSKKGVMKMPPEGMRKFLQFVGDTFIIPDTKIGWKQPALKAARELLKHESFDAIFATAPPQTDFLIGKQLKQEFKIPLVVEYRDAWLDYPFKYFPTPLHRYLHKRLEYKVLKAADRIIVTHRRMKENILKVHRDLGFHDISIISQGYDEEDFDRRPTHHHKVKRMRIAHAGTFYGGRDPAVLIQALHNVLKADTHLRGRIELILIGNIREPDQKLVQRLGLQNDVSFTGYVDHRECTRLLQGSDVLWFINDNDLSSPGKLYEYFGSRKPILASIVEGYTKQLIEESKAAICVSLTDVPSHEAALRELFARSEKKTLPAISQQFADRFNRYALTAELAKVFESLLDHDFHQVMKPDGGDA